MAYAFGTLKERLTGAEFHFIADGTVVSTVTIGAAAKPAAAAFTGDYSLGRINNSKYVPKTKDRNREFYDGTQWKERTTKSVTEDAFEITVIDYATSLFDQLAFGLESAPVDDTEQQAFAAGNRYKDGWAQLTLKEEDGTVMGVLTIHVRLEIATHPEIKNEDGSPVWRIVHLADAGELDGYIPYPAAP